MAIWKNSKMFFIRSDGADIVRNYPFQVLVDDKRIVVSYFAEEESISYSGVNKNNDHIFLDCHALDGEASLHRLTSVTLLIGTWVEGGDEGFWKIELS